MRERQVMQAELELSRNLVKIVEKYNLTEAELAKIYAEATQRWVGYIVAKEWKVKPKH